MARKTAIKQENLLREVLKSKRISDRTIGNYHGAEAAVLAENPEEV